MSYKLIAKSEQDLEDIYEYTYLNWGELQADKYLSELNKAFDMLSAFPNLGKKFNHAINVSTYPYKSNNIVHLVHLKEIVILRILHYRQDLEVKLSNVHSEI